MSGIVTEAGRCLLHGPQCAWCRDPGHGAWRVEVGAPEACPEGMDGPGLTEKLRNLAHAGAKEAAAIAHGTPAVTAEEVERRMGICLGCVWLINGDCVKCGCAVKRKTAWRSQRCPIGKWG